MNIGIFGFGIFVTVLLMLGFAFTMKEFTKMYEHPSDYRDDNVDEKSLKNYKAPK